MVKGLKIGGHLDPLARDHLAGFLVAEEALDHGGEAVAHLLAILVHLLGSVKVVAFAGFQLAVVIVELAAWVVSIRVLFGLAKKTKSVRVSPGCTHPAPLDLFVGKSGDGKQEEHHNQSRESSIHL